MTTNSNTKGRAYEYAWINSIYKALRLIERKTNIINNSSYLVNKRAWDYIDKETQKMFEISARSAIDTLFELEPRITENNDDSLTLEFQNDQTGTIGDVRDILIKRDHIEWVVGLSIKHNHEAVKHSRLSYRLDFGQEWFGIPCSNEYWRAVDPLFDRLQSEKNKGTKWTELTDKEENVYAPLLTAFINEVKKAYKSDATMPGKMIEYLIGTKDYYKIVSLDKERSTSIHAFNVHNTLNKPGKIKASAISVPKVGLPTELIALKFKEGSKNTVEMYLNNGWQLSFRIHNASAFVEPSLKFDIQLIGMPVSILTIKCIWK